MYIKKEKTVDTTVSFRIEQELKDRWVAFVKKHNINQKKTISKMLEEIMSS